MTVAVRSWIRQNPVCAASILCSDVSRVDANWCDMHTKDDEVDGDEQAFSWSRLCGVADASFCREFSIGTPAWRERGSRETGRELT